VSWYGPGLHGNKLSCGGTLTPGTLGVANKTLPCGSHVTLRRGHRVVRVPAVDRGPYVAGREFDLTAATRDKLHFGGAGSVLVAA
jgi:rare lipoprotein A (peptidoglycan hydrolase)